MDRSSLQGEPFPHMATKCPLKDGRVSAIDMPSNESEHTINVVYMQLTKACRITHYNYILRVVLVLSTYSITLLSHDSFM